MAICDYQCNIISAGGNGQSPLAGKKICLIGDSNTQYSGNSFKTHFEETYGCTFTPMGYAGAAWENTTTTSQYSAVGRVNSLIAGADESTKLCSDYDIVLIMMGTNCTQVGSIEDSSASLTTMCGAVRYCLEKLLYFYRKSKIGVILPPQRNKDNEYQIQRNDLIQQICEEYAVATLDLQRQGQIVGDSRLTDGSSYYLEDGLHFGANGVIQFKKTVGQWMAYSL